MLSKRLQLHDILFRTNVLPIINQESVVNQKWVPCEMEDRYPMLSRRSFNNDEPITILTENNARAILKNYCDGCYVIFQNNNTLHLLAKIDSKLREFALFKYKQSMAWGD